MTTQKLRFFTVDAFSKHDGPGVFSGNPAGVILLPRDSKLPDNFDILQAIAAEINLSETAFVQPMDDDNHEKATAFDLRWFTPIVEVPLCGHATLASSHVLLNELKNPAKTITFQTTNSGLLTAQKDAATGFLAIDLPSNPPFRPLDLGPLQELIDVTIGTNLKSKVLSASYAPKLQIVLLRLDDSVGEQGIRSLAPNFTKIVQASHNLSDKSQPTVYGVVVTTRGNAQWDFFSRCFFPENGIDEDPVTGAAHTILAPFWSGVLGKNKMLGKQCSARTGEVSVELIPDEGDGRVRLLGRSSVVIDGWFNTPNSL